MIGNPRYYHLLFAYDEVFREIFKVKADFDYQVDRDRRGAGPLRSVRRPPGREGGTCFRISISTGVAALMDESSRFVEDQQKLSHAFRRAQRSDSRGCLLGPAGGQVEIVAASCHVEQAVEEAEFRASLRRKERVQELIQRDVLMVDTDGAKSGQINGLAVHMLGDYLFGRPARITCATSTSVNEGVINIERRVRSCPTATHDKGVLILAGIPRSTFCPGANLCP